MPRIRKRPEYCDPNTQISTGNGEFATYNSVYRRFGHGPSRGRGILRQNNPLGEIQSATGGRVLEKDHVLSSWNVPPTELDANLLYCARFKYESEACRQENHGYNPDRYLDCIDDDSKERLLELHKDDYYGDQQDSYSSWCDDNPDPQDYPSNWFDANPDQQECYSSWFDGNPDQQDYPSSWFDASVDYESRWSNFDSSKYQTPQGIDNMLDRLKEEEIELRRRKLGLWNQRMMRKTYDVLDPFHPYGEVFYQNETCRMYKEPIIKKKSKRKSKKNSKRNRKLEERDYSEESKIRSYCDVCCVKVDEPLSEHNLSDFHMIKVEICKQGCPYCFVTKFNNFNHFGHHILEGSHSDIMKLAKKKSESLQKELVLEINPKFDSKLGEDYVEPITGFFCRLCRQFIHEEEDTILKHCQLTVHQALHHNHIENCCSIERAIADEMIRKSAISQEQGCSTKDEPNAPVIIDSFSERNVQILRRDEVIDQLESDISSEDIHLTSQGHNCPIIKSNEHPESSHPEPNMELIHQGLEPNTATQQGLGPNMALIQQGLKPNMALIQQGLVPNIELIQQGLEPNMALIQQGLEPNMALIQQGLEPNIELFHQGLEPNIELIQQGLDPDHINTQSREESIKPPQLQTCELGVVVEQLIDELIQHSLDVHLLTTEPCEHYSESSEQQHQMEPIVFHAKPTEKAHQMENILVDLNSSEQTMSRKCSAEIHIPKTEPNEHALETREHAQDPNGHKLQPNEHDLEPNEHDLEQNEHDLETSEHAPDISNAEPNGRKLEQNEHDVEQNEHDVEQKQNVCNTEQNEHDLVTYEHVLEQNEQDLVPYEHDLVTYEHVLEQYEHDLMTYEHVLEQNEQDLVPYEHDLEPIEHDLEPNICNAEPNTSNTGQPEVTGAIETGPRQNSSAAEQLNPSVFGGDKLEYNLSCAQTGSKQNSSATEQLNPSGFDDDKRQGVRSGAQAALNDQGKEEVKNVIAQLIELSLDIHLSMTEQGGRKVHPFVSEPSELCSDKVSDFTEQNEDLLEKNNYVSHPTECVDLGLKSNKNCLPRLKHKSINMRHVYPHRNVSNSSTTDCSLNTEQVVNNQHKNEHNVIADALITKKQTESNLSAKEQSEPNLSAVEQINENLTSIDNNLKTAEQSVDNPKSTDLSAAEHNLTATEQNEQNLSAIEISEHYLSTTEQTEHYLSSTEQSEYSLSTIEQSEDNLKPAEQSKHNLSASELSEDNLKTAQQSEDNPTSIDLPAAEDQPQITEHKLR